MVQLLKKNHFFVTQEVFTKLFDLWIQKNQFEQMHENKKDMVDKLLKAQMNEENQSLENENKIVIFDRGMIDIKIFCQEIAYKIMKDQEKLMNQSHYDFVIIPEPLNKNFYNKNSVRRQSYEESLLRHEICLKSYQCYFKNLSLNPEERIIVIPRFSEEKNNSIQLRMNFILNKFYELEIL